MSELDARLGMEMLSQQFIVAIDQAPAAFCKFPSKLGFAEAPTDKDPVLWPRTGTRCARSLFYFSNDGNMDEDFVAPCRVSSGKRTSQFRRSFMQSPQKFIEPIARTNFWQSHAEQETLRLASHGCNIAHGARQALPTDCFGGMCFS